MSSTPLEKDAMSVRKSHEASLHSGPQEPPADDTRLRHSEERGGFINHFRQDVRTSVIVEIQLLILTFCTGIQDAASFPDYHTFASNQTGNTVFLCLALIIPSLDGDMFYTANIGVALGLFLGAGWLTGQLSHIFGPRRRWWLILCNFIQTALVLGAAGLQWRYGIHTHGTKALLQIGMLAFASGSQVVQSRSLAATEISTAMATAAWVDLLIDQNLLTLKNRPRTRRLSFLLALVSGSLLGAGLWHKVNSPTAIAISAVGKLLVTVMYVFVRPVKPKQTPSSV